MNLNCSGVDGRPCVLRLTTGFCESTFEPYFKYNKINQGNFKSNMGKSEKDKDAKSSKSKDKDKKSEKDKDKKSSKSKDKSEKSEKDKKSKGSKSEKEKKSGSKSVKSGKSSKSVTPSKKSEKKTKSKREGSISPSNIDIESQLKSQIDGEIQAKSATLPLNGLNEQPDVLSSGAGATGGFKTMGM